MANERGPLRNARIFFQGDAFALHASTAIAKNKQRLYLTEGVDPDPVRQLVVQLEEHARNPIDGIAQNDSLLVVLLEPGLFLKLLERLYRARNNNQPLLFSMESDAEGRIVSFEPRILTDTIRPASKLDQSFDELEPMPDWNQVA